MTDAFSAVGADWHLTNAPRVLLAYIHLRPATPAATVALLRDYIHAYAHHQRYEVGCILVGHEGHDERVTVRRLILEIEQRDAVTVLVAGVSHHAMAALAQFTKARLITLHDIIRANAREQ